MIVEMDELVDGCLIDLVVGSIVKNVVTLVYLVNLSGWCSPTAAANCKQ